MRAAGHACGRPFVKPPDSSAARVLRDVFYILRRAAAGRGGRPDMRTARALHIPYNRPAVPRGDDCPCGPPGICGWACGSVYTTVNKFVMVAAHTPGRRGITNFVSSIYAVAITVAVAVVVAVPCIGWLERRGNMPPGPGSAPDSARDTPARSNDVVCTDGGADKPFTGYPPSDAGMPPLPGAGGTWTGRGGTRAGNPGPVKCPARRRALTLGGMRTQLYGNGGRAGPCAKSASDGIRRAGCDPPPPDTLPVDRAAWRRRHPPVHWRRRQTPTGPRRSPSNACSIHTQPPAVHGNLRVL